MGIKQLYNDNLRKLPNEYEDVSVMVLNINFAAMQVTDDDVSIFYGSKMKKKMYLKSSKKSDTRKICGIHP